MALSKKINKAHLNANPSIENLILKGGTSGGEEDENNPQKQQIKRMQLRLPLDKLAQIDQLVRARPGNPSRHTWFMEAIEEKLQKDGTSSKVMITSL